MRELPGFVIHGAPRTKKNSSRVVTIPTKGARRCRACGHMPGFRKVLPSEAYEAWEAAALQEMLLVRQRLRGAGIDLPILTPVSVTAAIYRDRNVGDAVGYYQAVGDMLQRAGVLKDDRQIEDWDGSRRLLDPDNPRVEIFLTVLTDVPVQESLL